MAPRFRVTYATLSADNDDLHTAYSMIAPEGTGVFFAHFMGSMLHSPVVVIYGERLVSTRQSTVSQRKVRPAFFWSAPGSKPASVSTWKPLQMPTTGPPAAANRATASITVENRAIAPVLR